MLLEFFLFPRSSSNAKISCYLHTTRLLLCLLCLNKGCLLVNKRRGKEQDQTGKGDNSKEREEVSAKVLNVGRDHVGCGNLGGKISHGVFHKVQLWCVPCGECRVDCGSYPAKDQYIRR